MSSNVTHLNEMLNKLQKQHQIRIDYLEKKILECEGEIQQLKSFIKSK
jgi:cob(I)alamin adenosyltransferase